MSKELRSRDISLSLDFCGAETIGLTPYDKKLLGVTGGGVERFR